MLFNLVQYVENSTPRHKKFKTIKAAKKFVADFKKKNPTPEDGNWVDFIIHNVEVIEYLDEYYME